MRLFIQATAVILIFSSFTLSGCIVAPPNEGWSPRAQSEQPVHGDYDIDGTWSFVDKSGARLVNELWLVGGGMIARRKGDSKQFRYSKIGTNLYEDSHGQTYEFPSDRQAVWRNNRDGTVYHLSRL